MSLGPVVKKMCEANIPKINIRLSCPSRTSLLFVIAGARRSLCGGRNTAIQGRTQGGVLGLKPPLELDILRKLYYLRKGD